MSLARFDTTSEPFLNIPNLDKVVHFAMYFIFVFLILAETKTNIIKKYIKISVISISLGIFVEIVQYFIPYRSADILDVLADFSGTVMGIFFYYFIIKIQVSRNNF